MGDPVAISVVMATYDRGRHILPSVRAVLAQADAEFELLIVGDHCTDDTAELVAPFLSERVRWLNLPARTGNQSGPNTAGIAAARGRYIAYCGHDDIWAPGHVSALLALQWGLPRGFYLITSVAAQVTFFPLQRGNDERASVTAALGVRPLFGVGKWF